jgi:hypothetical protein
VLDPQAVVLVGVEPRHQRALEVIHDGPLIGLCDALLGEGQHPTGVPLGIVAGIDQRLGLIRIAAQHLGALAVPIPAQEVANGP